VYDWEKSGSHCCLGVAKVTVQEVSQGTQQLRLDHPTTGKPTKAQISFESMCLVERPSFLDYLKGGLQIGFTCAIDFTASNGPAKDPASLHNLLQSPNQYEAAIQAVGNVIEFYNPSRYAAASSLLSAQRK
jgi:copine 5/8/9